MPPYDGSSASYWGLIHNESGEGQFTDLKYYADYPTGNIGHRSEYENGDAGDFDYMFLHYYTHVGFWYKSASGGLKEIHVKLRCIRARSVIKLEDESGWSDSNTWMNSYFTVNQPSVSGGYEEIPAWSAERHGSPDAATYDDWWYPPDYVVWLHTFKAFFSNQWAYLTVGTHDVRETNVNDVATNQAMRNQWQVEEVQIKD